MDATVKGSFWTDSRIEELKPAAKLAALWMVTNPARDLLGFTHVSARRFVFETGLAISDLQAACEALPSSFKGLPNHWYFAVNFLRHQCGGKGGKLSEKNNVVISAIRQARSLPSPLQGAFLEAYPELQKSVHPGEENTSPSGGVIASHSIALPLDSGMGSGETIVAAETIVGSYPRREATAECLGIVAGHIAAGCDPAAMLAGTRAIAAVIAFLPSGARNAYVIGAPRFFREKRWQDDPETWLRQADKLKAGTVTDDAVMAALGGRADE